MKVSIIVPIYNVDEIRLRRCLDTLVNQTLREIEIICVLDCPTDNSDHIVTEYALNDSRIVVVRNSKNYGVSYSRNRGLEIAKGEYIGFSDCDDYRDLRMYELLYQKAINDNADAVVSDTTVISEVGETEIDVFGNPTIDSIRKAIILPWIGENPHPLSHSCWNAIYRRDLICSEQICFKERSDILEEDVDFNLRFYLSAKKIAYVPKPLYTWWKHYASLSNREITNIAVKQLNQAKEMISSVQKHDYFHRGGQEAFHILISHNIRVYFPEYKRLNKEYMVVLHHVLWNVGFPPCGRYPNLKIISKKRVMLFLFIVKVKYFLPFVSV